MMLKIVTHAIPQVQPICHTSRNSDQGDIISRETWYSTLALLPLLTSTTSSYYSQGLIWYSCYNIIIFCVAFESYNLHCFSFRLWPVWPMVNSKCWDQLMELEWLSIMVACGLFYQSILFFGKLYMHRRSLDFMPTHPPSCSYMKRRCHLKLVLIGYKINQFVSKKEDFYNWNVTDKISSCLSYWCSSGHASSIQLLNLVNASCSSIYWYTKKHGHGPNMGHNDTTILESLGHDMVEIRQLIYIFRYILCLF